MKYIKTFEYENPDLKELLAKKKLLVDTFINLAQHVYPKSNFIIKDLDNNDLSNDGYSIMWENIEELGIERLNSRNIKSFKWITVKGYLSIEIGFAGYNFLMDDEVTRLEINKYLIDIIYKYRWTGNFRALTINKKDVQNIIDDISIDDFEMILYSKKYNIL